MAMYFPLPLLAEVVEKYGGNAYMVTIGKPISPIEQKDMDAHTVQDDLKNKNLCPCKTTGAFLIPASSNTYTLSLSTMHPVQDIMLLGRANSRNSCNNRST